MVNLCWLCLIAGHILQVKVRARLSRPLQRGRGKHISHADSRPGLGDGRGHRGSWGRPVPLRHLPVRPVRGIGERFPPADRGVHRPAAFRDRRPAMATPPRGRPVAPIPRSYDRRPPGV